MKSTLSMRPLNTCLNRISGLDVDAWAVVPSSRGRPVLRNLVSRILSDPALLEIPVRFVGPPDERLFAPEHWPVRIDRPVRHVILVDDSWVSGSHAQSVASSLKGSGIQQVSIFAVARVLRANWTASKPLVAKLHGGTFDWKQCPWTGGACPADPRTAGPAL